MFQISGRGVRGMAWLNRGARAQKRADDFSPGAIDFIQLGIPETHDTLSRAQWRKIMLRLKKVSFRVHVSTSLQKCSDDLRLRVPVGESIQRRSSQSQRLIAFFGGRDRLSAE